MTKKKAFKVGKFVGVIYDFSKYLLGVKIL
jgi:hypothetical protein